MTKQFVYMFFNRIFYNIKSKKNFIVFVFQMLFLVLSLFLVLWGQKKLKMNSSTHLERKAQFIAPEGE